MFVRIDWKSMPETNTAYDKNYGQKSLITLGPGVSTCFRLPLKVRKMIIELETQTPKPVQVTAVYHDLLEKLSFGSLMFG